ncbi:MAG: hypothetical protein FWF92_00565 [Oscillospiraceae bacterium]|nr:hypothetical protein [Oscillospiraceae bacterium]
MDKNDLILNFNVKGQLIYYQEKNKAAADSMKYLYAKFSFSREWDISPKYALFYGSDKTSLPIEVQLENDGCYVPQEVIKPPRFYVSVYCANAVKRITTEKQAVSVLAGGYAGDTAQSLPSQGNTISIHTPADETKITQFRNNGGVAEFTSDGTDWQQLKGVSDIGRLDMIDF